MKGYLIGFVIFVVMLVVAAQIAKRSKQFSNWTGLNGPTTA